MTFYTLLLIYYTDTFDLADDIYVFDTPQECSDAMPLFFETKHDIVCVRTDIPSGSIRPKARVVRPSGDS